MPTAITNQHTVPRFLLRNFVFAGTQQVFVFDKLTERSFPKRIKHVASESGFYDCMINDEPYSVDPLLTDLENVASKSIRKIVRASSVRPLSCTDRKIVGLFAAVQMLRTDARRKQMKDENDSFRQAVERAGIDPNKIHGFDFLDAEQARVASITSLAGLAVDFLPYFLNKIWILLSTSEERPFYISDNPVTMFNSNYHPFKSTLGLRVPGIQIYLPLSPTLCLGFYCPAIKLPLRIRLFGGRLRLSAASVEHLNSLQVFNAEQYIYSQRDDFAVVHAIVQSVPTARRGPRWE